MKQFVSRLLVSALVCVTAIPCALALPASHYATSSKLATGKWVKIQIPQSGVYELTYDELSKMGFDNPQNVRIYGSGGNMLNEMLDGTAPDDLTAVRHSRSSTPCPLVRTSAALSMPTPTTATIFSRSRQKKS